MKRQLPCLILCFLVSANTAWAQGNAAPVPGASGGVEAAPGPFLEKRQKLLSKIDAARQAGCGVAPYMNEFTRIENSLKSGQDPDTCSRQVDSLTKSIEYQLSRISIIRAQRPAHVYRKPTVVSADSPVEKTPPADGKEAASGDASKDASKGAQKTPATGTAKAADTSKKETSKLSSIRQTMKEQYPDRYNDKMTDDELIRVLQDDSRLHYLLDQVPAGK